MKVLWDPIASAAHTQEDILRSNRKEIQNILKSYVGYYDPFCELLQNALDAVDERRRKLREKDYLGTIWIEVNLKENTFSVTDNGIGFLESEFKTFLAPSVTFKDGEHTRGKKGVGATYLAYGFDFLQAGTKTPDFEMVTQITDARKWIDDKSGKLPRPQVTESKLIHEVFELIDRGSTFTLRFGSPLARPRDLDWIGAHNASQWRSLLLIKTPLGQVFQEGKAANTKFMLSVIDKRGRKSNIDDQPTVYIFPHKAVSSAIDLREIQKEQSSRLKKKPGSVEATGQAHHLSPEKSIAYVNDAPNTRKR